MNRLYVFLAAVVLLLLPALILSGCASDDWYYDDCCDGSPSVHYVTLLLNVSDQNGDPLPGCTVWLDGEAQPDKTLRSFRTLSDCDCDWDGYRYNWRVNDYRVEIPSWTDQERVAVWVTKPGWENECTRFTFYTWDDRYILARATFVMQPALGVTQVDPAQGREVPSDRCPAAGPAP